jgi:3-hydroxyacyl-CoA dehydrogenase
MEQKTLAVIGSGVIGAGWAANFAYRGHQVKVYDVVEEALASARERVTKNLNTLARYGIIQETDIPAIEANLTYSTDIRQTLEGVYLIMESGPDKIPIKQSILADVDKYAPADALFLSSTSGLSITAIAEQSQHPERCMVGHPLNPPYLIPLVELCKGQKTSQECIDRAVAFFESIKKVPVVCNREQTGYISNRIQWAIYREVVSMVKNGACSVEDVDRAIAYGNGPRLAIFGMNMILELGGGKDGIIGMNKLNATRNAGMKDLCKWDALPTAGSKRLPPASRRKKRTSGLCGTHQRRTYRIPRRHVG